MTAAYPGHQLFHVWEQSGCVALARVEDMDAALITQAGLSAITAKVIDADSRVVTYSGSLTIASVVFDTAQTGNGWPYSDGYNFRWPIPASAFPNGGRKYRAEVYFDPATGEDFSDAWDIFAEDLLGV